MTTYKIIRFYQDDDLDSEVILDGLTLDEAQAHCDDPDTSSRSGTSQEARKRTARVGDWFDGYEEE